MSDRPTLCGTGILPVVENHGQDGRATVRIRQGAYLPHWTRDGGFYAVVFRLHDSLPAHVLVEWKVERDRLLKKRSLTVADEQQLHRLFSDRVEKHLDAGYGDCWMRKPEIANVVANALNHFDGGRYRLLAWCVMPNHVHVVARPNPGHELERILHSWKSFSANEANKLLHRSEAFWQPEYYDHLIRDEADLFHAIQYTLDNPLVAGLRNWRWIGCAADIVSLLDGEPDACGTGILPVTGAVSDRDASHVHGQDGRATEHPDREECPSTNPTIRSSLEELGYGG
jgi:REP element-mobilizing transposase RayT